jgi:hypothetical protein
MSEKIGRRVHWLMAQMLCDKDPIVPEDLEVFGRNPHVIIPQNAIELIKAVDSFPSASPDWRRCVPGGLLLDENGPVALVYDMHTHKVHLYRRSNPIVDLGEFMDYCSTCHDAHIKLLAMIDGQPLWGTTS